MSSHRSGTPSSFLRRPLCVEFYVAATRRSEVHEHANHLRDARGLDEVRPPSAIEHAGLPDDEGDAEDGKPN